jgi:hypothetical protein
VNLEHQRRRLVITLAINGTCALVAVAAAVGGLGLHIGWMNWLFVGALVTGFAAQAWLIVGVITERPKP